MNSRSAALAGGVAVAALVAAGSFVLLGDDEGAPPVLGTASRPGGATTSSERALAGAGRDDLGGLRPEAAGGANAGADSAKTPAGGASGSSAGVSGSNGAAGPAANGAGNGAGPRPWSPGSAKVAPAPGAVEVGFECTDEKGERLPGVWIEVRRRSGAPVANLASDAQGVARMGTLPPGEAIEGVARHALSAQSVTFGPITIRAGSVVRLKFRRGSTGTLTGTIVDERGQAVPGARLRLVDPKQSGEAMLDGLAMGLGLDGTFRATVAAGAYSVWAEADGFAASDRGYVTVPSGEQAGPVELLLHAQGRIAGKVLLPPDLSAALPARVDLVVEVTRGTAENPYQHVEREPLEVDATMRFELGGCDPGRYRLRLEAPAAGGNRVGEWYSYTLEPGQSIEGVTIALKDTAPAVRGVVRDDQAVPIEGAKVSVRGRESVTDRDGRYAIHGLDAGEDILVEARAERHARTSQQATYEGAVLEIDLVLKRLGGVRGVVRATGGLRGSVPVLVCQQVDGGVRPYQVAAGADGQYLLEELPPGSYFIKAGQGANPFDPAGAPTVEVRPGEVVEAPDVVVP